MPAQGERENHCKNAIGAVLAAGAFYWLGSKWGSSFDATPAGEMYGAGLRYLALFFAFLAVLNFLKCRARKKKREETIRRIKEGG